MGKVICLKGLCVRWKNRSTSISVPVYRKTSCPYLPISKVPKEKENNERDRWLTDDEEKRLLENSPQWLRDIIVFDLHTGKVWRVASQVINIDIFTFTYCNDF